MYKKNSVPEDKPPEKPAGNRTKMCRKKHPEGGL